LFIDVAKLERDYFDRRPDVPDPTELVSFGTSGHRGSPFLPTFAKAHILAITQAICEYRSANGIDGPLFMGKDTHAISSAAQRTALEVLAANQVETVMQSKPDRLECIRSMDHAYFDVVERIEASGNLTPRRACRNRRYTASGKRLACSRIGKNSSSFLAIHFL
jgi:hypothetical protein